MEPAGGDPGVSDNEETAFYEERNPLESIVADSIKAAAAPHKLRFIDETLADVSLLDLKNILDDVYIVNTRIPLRDVVVARRKYVPPRAGRTAAEQRTLEILDIMPATYAFPLSPSTRGKFYAWGTFNAVHSLTRYGRDGNRQQLMIGSIERDSDINGKSIEDVHAFAKIFEATPGTFHDKWDSARRFGEFELLGAFDFWERVLWTDLARTNPANVTSDAAWLGNRDSTRYLQLWLPRTGGANAIAAPPAHPSFIHLLNPTHDFLIRIYRVADNVRTRCYVVQFCAAFDRASNTADSALLYPITSHPWVVFVRDVTALAVILRGGNARRWPGEVALFRTIAMRYTQNFNALMRMLSGSRRDLLAQAVTQRQQQQETVLQDVAHKDFILWLQIEELANPDAARSNLSDFATDVIDNAQTMLQLLTQLAALNDEFSALSKGNEANTLVSVARQLEPIVVTDPGFSRTTRDLDRRMEQFRKRLPNVQVLQKNLPRLRDAIVRIHAILQEIRKVRDVDANEENAALYNMTYQLAADFSVMLDRKQPAQRPTDWESWRSLFLTLVNAIRDKIASTVDVIRLTLGGVQQQQQLLPSTDPNLSSLAVLLQQDMEQASRQTLERQRELDLAREELKRARTAFDDLLKKQTAETATVLEKNRLLQEKQQQMQDAETQLTQARKEISQLRETMRIYALDSSQARTSLANVITRIGNSFSMMTRQLLLVAQKNIANQIQWVDENLEAAQSSELKRLLESESESILAKEKRITDLRNAVKTYQAQQSDTADRLAAVNLQIQKSVSAIADDSRSTKLRETLEELTLAIVDAQSQGTELLLQTENVKQDREVEFATLARLTQEQADSAVLEQQNQRINELSAQISRMEAEAADNEKRVRELETDRESANKEWTRVLEQFSAENTALDRERVVLEQQITARQQEIDELNDRIARFESERAQQDAKFKALEAQWQQAVDELEKFKTQSDANRLVLEKQVAELQNKLTNSTANLESTTQWLNTALAEFQERNQTLERDLRAKLVILASAAQDNTYLRRQLNQLNDRIAALALGVEEANIQYATLQKTSADELAQFRDELTAARSRVLAYENQLTTVVAEQQVAAGRINQLELSETDLKKQLDERKLELDASVAANTALSKDLSVERTHVEDQRKLVDDLQKTVDQLKIQKDDFASALATSQSETQEQLKQTQTLSKLIEKLTADVEAHRKNQTELRRELDARNRDLRLLGSDTVRYLRQYQASARIQTSTSAAYLMRGFVEAVPTSEGARNPQLEHSLIVSQFKYAKWQDQLSGRLARMVVRTLVTPRYMAIRNDPAVAAAAGVVPSTSIFNKDVQQRQLGLPLYHTMVSIYSAGDTRIQKLLSEVRSGANRMIYGTHNDEYSNLLMAVNVAAYLLNKEKPVARIERADERVAIFEINTITGERASRAYDAKSIRSTTATVPVASMITAFAATIPEGLKKYEAELLDAKNYTDAKTAETMRRWVADAISQQQQTLFRPIVFNSKDATLLRKHGDRSVLEQLIEQRRANLPAIIIARSTPSRHVGNEQTNRDVAATAFPEIVNDLRYHWLNEDIFRIYDHQNVDVTRTDMPLNASWTLTGTRFEVPLPAQGFILLHPEPDLWGPQSFLLAYAVSDEMVKSLQPNKVLRRFATILNCAVFMQLRKRAPNTPNFDIYPFDLECLTITADVVDLANRLESFREQQAERAVWAALQILPLLRAIEASTPDSNVAFDKLEQDLKAVEKDLLDDGRLDYPNAAAEVFRELYKFYPLVNRLLKNPQPDGSMAAGGPNNVASADVIGGLWAEFTTNMGFDKIPQPSGI